MRSLTIVIFLSAYAVAQRWVVQTTGVDTNLRGMSAQYASVDGKRAVILWAAGSNGVLLRSNDGGANWKQLNIPGGTDLDFRDVEGFGANTAYVMSSGEKGKSRIYKTTDSGANWKMQYSDERPGFFLDALACDSELHCVALSDPVDGKFLVVSTNDGEHWNELPRDQMPAALAGEGGFAGSGTTIALCGHGDIVFGTGGGRVVRVIHSSDRSHSWKATETPLASNNPSSGIFSITCSGKSIVAVGGDYKEPASAKQGAIYSNDFGVTWHLSESEAGGYRSAVAYGPHRTLVAVGPNGSDISTDGGRHWKTFDHQPFNAAIFSHNSGWAAGPKGTIAILKTGEK
ncbi:MAG: oxidoreductase [Acidobacteria bacterium]|nr:oxidoreductase [Acidobacteriota bacterium]